jgi:hypothetical protein
MSLKILELIADTIESRPVLGHWPHMRAKPDADYLRAVAKEREDLREERDGALGALARSAALITPLHNRIERLETAIKWVIDDCGYKAPEQIDAQMARRWIDRLSRALRGAEPK